jgi:hypothetical protein
MATSPQQSVMQAWRKRRTPLVLFALMLLVTFEARSFAAERPVGRDAEDVAPAVALINRHVADYWAAHELTPSATATDGEWCRRVYLDVLGRIPTVAELQLYLREPAARRKANLVDRLLGEEHVEEYARNWTTLWTNLLIGRTGGTERRTLVNRDGLQQALRRALVRNMPYDQLVYELVAAKGVNKPGEDNFNGFVNFMAGNLEENAVQATAKTSQIFLGIQVQCTQCHNHPFNEWKQNQFWELNAFFRQTRAVPTRDGRRVDSVELVNQDFAGETNQPEEAVLFYELRNGLSKAAYPVFVDGTPLASTSGYVDQVDRRTELARLIVGYETMPKALVNRIWAHFLGYGFTKPVDDLGPHNAPTHPQLLDELSAEFKNRGYDLKALMRWIVLSEPYSLSSKATARNKRDDPSLGEKPAFSRFYLRQMRAEELYESLLTATEADQTATSYEEREKTKADWLSQFATAFGTDDNEETTTFDGTIPQTLMMMNGDLMEKATSTTQGSFLYRVATDNKMNNAAKIRRLYEAALARQPSSREIALANELLQLRGGDAAAALQDIWWAVLNSNEFILNH